MTTLKQTFLSGLRDYIPTKSLDIVADWLVHYRVHLTITHRRTTKIGDYRQPHNGKGHRISVNHNLNQYSFLVTLLHEIAHLTTWEKYERENNTQIPAKKGSWVWKQDKAHLASQPENPLLITTRIPNQLPNTGNALSIYGSGRRTHKRIKPHGEEWKKELRTLMQPLFGLGIFPKDISAVLAYYLNNPAASTCADPHLLMTLRSYDKNKNGVTLEELALGAVFSLVGNEKVFRKGEKLRKRYKCEEVYSNRTYLVSPVAEVRAVD